MKWELNKKRRLSLAGVWLLLTFSLSAWWMIHGMGQADRLESGTLSSEFAARITFATVVRVYNRRIKVSAAP